MIEPSAGPVSLIVDGSAGAPVTVVLAHGAGAGMEHPFMSRVAQGIAAAGVRVVRFNFPFTNAGRRRPDPQPVLENAFRAVVDSVRNGPEKLVLGGKSLGGRIASHVAAAGTACDGLLFLGYPLHPPGRPDRVRDQHLRSVTAPMLFVEGTRDPFCPLDTLAAVRRSLSASVDVAVIEDGDHSFNVRRSSGRDRYAAWEEVVAASVEWLRGVSGT